MSYSFRHINTTSTCTHMRAYGCIVYTRTHTPIKMEVTLGTFPYGKWTTIFEQLNAVVNGPAPRLPCDGRFSDELREFAAAW